MNVKKKKKEVVVYFRKNKPSPSPACINGNDVEIFQTYRYLGVHLENKLGAVH